MPTFDEIQALFFDALAVPEGEREAFLTRRAVDRPEVLRGVRDLLRADTDPSPFVLDRPIVRVHEDPPPLTPGHLVGPYEVVREIGRGGMGAVYLARHRELGREVALKVIRSGGTGVAARERFLHERRLLARLEHPHIARLYEAGVTAEGAPFFAMEFVEGVPVTAFAQALPLRERVALLSRIARAVQFAHRHLVVHLDLKPSNVLVTPEGEPRLLDFGIAAVIDETATDDPPPSRGTPGYVAPEILAGGPASASADVYGLGILLYAVLTGAPPPRGDSRSPPPSTAAPDGAPLRGDLDAICLAALQPDPDRRTPSAEAFADDLDRYLDSRPVRARPTTPAVRGARFVRRNRAAVATAAVGLIALASVAAVAGVRLRAERDRALGEAARSEAVLGAVLGLFASADPREDAAVLDVATFLDRGADRARDMRTPADRAAVLQAIHDANAGLGRDSAARDALLDALRFSREASDSLGAGRALLDLGWLDLRGADFDAALRRFASASRSLDGAESGPEAEGAGWPAEALHGLGLALNGTGARARAERHLEAALAGLRALPTVPRAHEASVVNDLGVVRHGRGDDADAERYLREALALRRRHLGPDHLDVSHSAALLGFIRLRAGDAPAAESLYAEALRIRQKRLPPGHPLLGETTSGLDAARAARRR